MSRSPDVGQSKTLSLTVPAGLYRFLTLHARRAIDGKSEGEIALFLMQQQAALWEREKRLGIAYPTEEFLKPPESSGGSKAPKRSPKGSVS